VLDDVAAGFVHSHLHRVRGLLVELSLFGSLAHELTDGLEAGELACKGGYPYHAHGKALPCA
jgi:hypothetical protein